MGAARRPALAVAAAAAAALALAALPGAARAAEWCGTVGTADRAPVLAGNPVRVLYAIPADGVDRSAEMAARISADVDEIDAWWRLNDPGRTPRFDVARFACGVQVDLTLQRLAATAADLLAGATRWPRVRDELDRAGLDSTYTKYLVYYDGPVEDPRLCGQGGGGPDVGGIAVIHLGACPSVSSASTAAHELLHTFGALAGAAAPNACAESRGHVCDSSGDILYRFAQAAPLASFVLDLNRDDYYGHGRGWFDVRDSAWLRHLDAQVPLSLVLRGRGTVTSDAPGVGCAVSCRSEWNAGSLVTLRAEPARGQRLVRWTGACASASDSCALTLDAAIEVTAFFAPARFPLALSVRGRGRIAGAGIACAVVRCARAAPSYRLVTLRATPAQGWRLRGWSGGCRGARPTCRLPMTKAASVRATFVRRS